MLNVYTTLLAVVSIPIIYGVTRVLAKIFYIAKCRRRTGKLPGLPTLPIIGNLHQVSLLCVEWIPEDQLS